MLEALIVYLVVTTCAWHWFRRLAPATHRRLVWGVSQWAGWRDTVVGRWLARRVQPPASGCGGCSGGCGSPGRVTPGAPSSRPVVQRCLPPPRT